MYSSKHSRLSRKRSLEREDNEHATDLVSCPKMPRRMEMEDVDLKPLSVEEHKYCDDSGVQHKALHNIKNAEPEVRPCLVFILEKKISSGHLTHLKGVAKKRGFPITPILSDAVTHIVTVLPTYERVASAIESDVSHGVEVVNLEWLTTSFLEGKPTTVTDHHRLKKKLQHESVKDDSDTTSESHDEQPLDYECQRVTLLKHHNHVFTEALEVLERYYFHVDYKQGDTRALAFRQASCALKSLSRPVQHIDEVSGLHRIGRHSSQVIKEILNKGFSTEVEECKNNEWFQCMELFSSVYGCGSATADKWYHKGLRTIEQVQQCKDIQLTETQQLGLEYYDHLSQPVCRDDTELIVSYIQSQVESIFTGTTVEAVGGYRRGKPHGHDVDLLLSHPDHQVTDVLLERLLACLYQKGVVIHADVTTGNNTLTNVQHSHVNTYRSNYTPDGKQRRVKFDYLDKAFCILKLQHDHLVQKEVKAQKSVEMDNKQDQKALIRRVDLIVCPKEQYPFALVSWTGSKQFNRSMRRYSAKELNMSVTAHGIYDNVQKTFLPATREEDVFSILKLNYLEPWQRNC